MRGRATILGDFHKTTPVFYQKSLQAGPAFSPCAPPSHFLRLSAAFSSPVVSTRNGPWFTYMIIVIGSRRAPLSATGKRNKRVLLLPESGSSEYISPIDYIRLAPPKIIIGVLARVAKISSTYLGRIRDLRPRFRRASTTAHLHS